MNHPSGTVTFLFTDIQGSTRLWQEKPAAMVVAHARHNAILRNAIETNHGYVFQVIGDAFCAAFHTAQDALRAALKAQTDLHKLGRCGHQSTDGHPHRRSGTSGRR